jgi:ribosome-binding protein aMBF1 (putative translation factor)
MTPEQCRAARGWLGWSQVELAKRANVSTRTVAAFERADQTPQPNNLAAMRRAIEVAGIRLLFNRDGVSVGILLEGTEPELSGDAPPVSRSRD